jgi:hypothetical protein
MIGISYPFIVKCDLESYYYRYPDRIITRIKSADFIGIPCRTARQVQLTDFNALHF